MKPACAGVALAWKTVVLSSDVLGGAEIFALERLRRSDGNVLHCNARLAVMVGADPRYAGLTIRTHASLDALARAITLSNARQAARALQRELDAGQVILGNLRAAAIQLVSSAAACNHAFVHDNTHYLNTKARWLIALAGLRSASLGFPCAHSAGRLPLRAMLQTRLRVEYFDRLHDVAPRPPREPSVLRLLNIGRIEANKNQLEALAIARHLAHHHERLELTFLGDPEPSYWDRVRHEPLPPGMAVHQLRVSRSEVGDVIDRHDAVLHTSRIESLPLVMFESNARHVPFFAFPIGGIPEVLPARFLLPDDPAAAGRQILNLLSTGALPGQVPAASAAR